MATSSLKKSFTISSKKEADAFAKMLEDSLKNPPEPLPEVKVREFSHSELSEIINARLCKAR